MNQRRQQQGNRGGGQRQQPQQQQDQAPALSPQQQLAEIVRGVEGMRGSIEAVLPRHTSFGAFRAILMMAIRHNPDIMTCNTGTIITSCMRAAYDGVVLDGREAALIPSNNKVKIDGRDVWRREARYNIMVAGMRKQIIAGGKVRDLQTTVVYANDEFSYRRGLDPDLTHVPVLDADKRGEKVGAYSVAWFVDGGAPSFEVMNRKQIEAVRDMAQSGPVWKGPVDDEMWRKTVLRRHRKSLPGGNDISDMEARADFPQFVQGDLTPRQEHSGELPAKVQDDAAPRRADFAQLEHIGGENGEPLDFGTSGELTAEEVAREDARDDAPAEQQKAAPSEAEQRKVGPVPEGFDSWTAWGDGVATRLKTAANLVKLDAVTNDVRELFEQAPDEVRDALDELYTLRADDHRKATA